MPANLKNFVVHLVLKHPDGQRSHYAEPLQATDPAQALSLLLLSRAIAGDSMECSELYARVERKET